MQTISIDKFSRYIFWSYRPNAILPVGVAIEQVLKYGELEDISTLFKLVKKEDIKRFIQNKEEDIHWEKRLNLIQKIFM